MRISTKIQRECKVCGKQFVTFRAWLRGGKAGMFCSNLCRNQSRIGIRPKNYARVIKNCKNCGKEFIVKQYRKISALYCSDKCRWEGHGILYSGSNSPMWKGGISERDNKSKKWAREVKRHDGYKCVECDSEKNVQAHHKKGWADNPDLRYDVGNGETLCSNCHAKRHPEMANWIQIPRIRSGIIKSCKVCGKGFYTPPHKIKTAKFCSRKCQHFVLHNLLRSRGKKG